MTAYHLCEWVFPELSGRPDFPHRDLGAFRQALKDMADSPIADQAASRTAGSISSKTESKPASTKALFNTTWFSPVHSTFPISGWSEKTVGGSRSKISSMS
jgi:hypothetical protein